MKTIKASDKSFWYDGSSKTLIIRASKGDKKSPDYEFSLEYQGGFVKAVSALQKATRQVDIPAMWEEFHIVFALYLGREDTEKERSRGGPLGLGTDGRIVLRRAEYTIFP